MAITADLTGQAVLVTGGASGIGLATVERFARSGARVALNHLPDDPAGPRQAERLTADGLSVVAVPGDVSDPVSAPRLVAEALERLGRLDGLVNNAGTPMAREPIPFADLEAIDEAFWDGILATNLLGPFRCAKAAAPALRATRGSIVNLASVAGLSTAGSSLPYAVSKAGVIHLTRTLAKALAPEVRVNAVAPGFVDTPWTQPWAAERKRATVEATWLGRTCRPEEIAEAILFLHAGASFVTGHTLVCDGGRPH